MGTKTLVVLVLLAPAVTSAAEPPAAEYATDHIAAFVALGRGKPVDGIDYFDESTVFAGGLSFVSVRGFHFASEVAAGEGNGVAAPDQRLVQLSTAFGWRFHGAGGMFAVELLDYRADAGWAGRLSHQGIGLRHRRGTFEAEFAYEPRRAYYYPERGVYFANDTRRVAFGWQPAVTTGVALDLAVGINALAWGDIHYRYVLTGLQWRWRDLDWLLIWHAASRGIEPVYTAALDRQGISLRVSRSFDLR